MKKISLVFLVLIVLALAVPALAHAQVVFGSASIPNFLNARSVKELITNLVNFLVFIGIIAAAFLIVYAGVRMMLSFGNEERYRKAKEILLWAVIGFTILILARVFVQVVGTFVGTGSPAGVTGSNGEEGGPASAPMIFVDMNISGDGEGSVISAAGAPFDGFYTPPTLDSGEYIAKLLDVNGETLFVHPFNAPNTVIGEVLDASGNIDPAQLVGGDIGSLNAGMVLPAITGAKTLVITDAIGNFITQQTVASAIQESHRKFALRHGSSGIASEMTFKFAPNTARAAGGMLRIAVLGVNYPSQEEFDGDWQAFRDLLLSLEPYAAFASAISIEPVGFLPLSDTRLNCSQNECAPAYSCNQSAVTALTNSQGPYDTVLTFVRSGTLDAPTGCAYFDTSISSYDRNHNEMDLGVGGQAFVTTVGGKRNFVARTAVHEFSHSFGSLLDEYHNKPTPYFSGRNCDGSQTCPLWDNATYNITACIAGCAGKTVYYRSSPSSLMRSLSDPFGYNALSRVLLQKRLAKVGIAPFPGADTQKPTVNITSPKQTNPVTALKDNFAIWAVTSDNVGAVRVDFLANDALIGAGRRGDDLKSFEFDWDISSINDGSYRLQAKAYDAAGNSSVSPGVVVTLAPADAACVPNCSGPPVKCGGDNGCGGTCNNTCTGVQAVCQPDNTTCCVPNKGSACNTNICIENMSIQCDGSCGGGTAL
ncbi:MAG: Ig-like domain-containing protein [bacterium]|nr:Ig-like domain-containing protein [bacterium]